MKPFIFAAAAAVLLGCAKEGGMAGYEPPSGLFRLKAPAEWRVEEPREGARVASFSGPGGGPRAFSARVSVYHYPPGSGYASPRDYAARNRLPGAEHSEIAESSGRLSYTTRRTEKRLHSEERRLVLEETVLVPAGEGFFALVLAAPEDVRPAVAPAFAALVESFEPRDARAK